MYPTLLNIGPISIKSYGLMMAIAFMFCAFLLGREAPKHGIKSEVMIDFVFWVAISGIIGARIYFILISLDYFLQYPVDMIMLHKGGLAWQGGLISSVLTAIYYFKKNNLPVLKTFDLAAPYIALGQSIGRIGCFLNGCCYGKPVSWGIYFPVHNARLHPTQLYSTLGLLIVFFVLKKFHRSSPADGKVFTLYIMLASALRFFIEFYRAEPYYEFFGFSIFQIFCIGFFVISFY
ncbi:Prolipoprotein diacylglyceryl transferase, partial [hydrothermal vent metagenome]